MSVPALTSQEARLLLDHLDNVQASSLPLSMYRVFWQAKHKLLCVTEEKAA